MNKKSPLLHSIVQPTGNAARLLVIANYVKAGGWISTILVFSYVGMFAALLQKNIAFFDLTFIVTQRSISALWVNFGIVALMVLDNTGEDFKIKSNRLVCASFFIAILMYGHAKNTFGNGNVYDLYCWMRHGCIDCILFSLYLFILIRIKYLINTTKQHPKEIKIVTI
jgi:hypothetical protein